MENPPWLYEDFMRCPVLLVLVLAACGGTMAQDPAERTTTRGTIAPRQTVDLTRDTEIVESLIQATPAQVWQALHEVHEIIGVPFAYGDVASGTAVFQLQNQIRTVAGKPASRYLDCGMGPAGPRADSYRLAIKVMHRFDSPVAGTTSLRTIMEVSARNPAISSDPVPCNSRGALEAEIGGMVTLRLKPAN
ncbi:MAG TPA: hypothetical protein VFZ04_22460 [Longimicrobiales bacterium]